MGEFSISHWLLFAAIMLVFFGPSKLPQLGSSLGKAIRGFKKGLSESFEEEEKPERPARPEQLEGAPYAQSTEVGVKNPEHQSNV